MKLTISLLLVIVFASCSELEKRPPYTYSVDSSFVKIGKLKESDAWVRDCKIHVAPLTKINSRYVELIILPPVSSNWAGIREKDVSFDLTGWDNRGSIQPVLFSRSSFGEKADKPFIYMIEWPQSVVQYVDSAKPELLLSSARN